MFKSIWRVALLAVMTMFDHGHNLPWHHGSPGAGNRDQRIRSLINAGVVPAGGAGGSTLAEMKAELHAKETELAKVYAATKTGSGNELRYDHTKAEGHDFETGAHMVEWFEGQQTAIAELNKEVTAQEKMRAGEARNRQALEAGVNPPTFAPDNEGSKDIEPKSFGDIVVEKFYNEQGKLRPDVAWHTDHYVDMNAKGNGSIEQVLKTDMTRSAGWEPENVRIGRVQLTAQPPNQVANLFPVIPVASDAVRYMLETTFTNNAAETAENAAIPESALALTEQTVVVQKIAASLPVTREQLNDVEQVRAYIDQRLRYQLLNRLDTQLIQGDGSAPNVEGLANVTGIQSVALSNEIPETIHDVITAIRANGYDEPDEILIHPTDWDQVATLKAADGTYIYQHPSNPNPAMLWGKPVTITTNIGSAGTGFVGAFAAQSALYMRQGIEVAITDSHASEFLDDVLRFKFTLRAVPVFFRPASFGEATGI